MYVSFNLLLPWGTALLFLLCPRGLKCVLIEFLFQPMAGICPFVGVEDVPKAFKGLGLVECHML